MPTCPSPLVRLNSCGDSNTDSYQDSSRLVAAPRQRAVTSLLCSPMTGPFLRGKPVNEQQKGPSPTRPNTMASPNSGQDVEQEFFGHSAAQPLPWWPPDNTRTLP